RVVDARPRLPVGAREVGADRSATAGRGRRLLPDLLGQVRAVGAQAEAGAADRGHTGIDGGGRGAHVLVAGQGAEIVGQAAVAARVAAGDEDAFAELGGLVVDGLLRVGERAPVGGLAAAQADADHGAGVGVDQLALEAEPGGAAA